MKQASLSSFVLRRSTSTLSEEEFQTKMCEFRQKEKEKEAKERERRSQKRKESAAEHEPPAKSSRAVGGRRRASNQDEEDCVPKEAPSIRQRTNWFTFDRYPYIVEYMAKHSSHTAALNELKKHFHPCVIVEYPGLFSGLSTELLNKEKVFKKHGHDVV
eukprot:TRINITY_DN11714_c1_g1_i3.p1 TRINITY_DN11714_c1_g1~~TRINITY_DN11714_c1_g1_i3.p1  ORF type:complete len:159 (+),score=22.94 TRINITY_DN11714_c1_g1_i3:55-531(+)